MFPDALPTTAVLIAFAEKFIPDAWFDSWHWTVLVAVAVVAMITLMKGADWLVEGASGLAYRLGLPKVIVGATIVSLGTTTPEAAVSVMAAWGGQPGLALGNAVGSIIADTGLIFGVGCLLTQLPADRFVLSRQGWVQFGSAVVLAAICLTAYVVAGAEAELGRWVGVLFLVGLAAYMYVSVRWSRGQRNGDGVATSEEHGGDGVGDRSVLLLFAMVMAGLVIVIIAARFLIGSVEEIAGRMQVPQTVIASTLVAFGTSVPELAVGITAIRRKHPEILVGNVIGADILNVLFVIGASAVAAPLAVQPIFLAIQIPAMLAILILFRVFIARAVRIGHFERWFGVPLVGLYAAFVILSLVRGVGGGH